MRPIAITKNPLSYMGIVETNPPQIYKKNRSPLTSDVRPYSIGDIWIDTTIGVLFILSNIAGTSADWEALGTVNSVTTDSGTANPVNGTITFTGANGLQTIAVGGTVTYQFEPLTDYTGSQREFRQASVQTTDDTQTDLFTVDIDEEQMLTIKGFINGFRDDYSECIGGDFVASFFRGTAGDVTVAGVPIININESSSGSPSFTIEADIGTQTVNIKVTGEVAKTFNWTATFEYAKLLSNA